ncbi:hypothetical protein [Xylanibacter rarus]|uniref:hypothetical protein n=1 Tax=Xylanibacter rarus TaxID=1676614 RepID=UPI003520A85F
MREGQECLVALYVDKSSRLCATMKVYHYLSTRTPYVAGDSVKGRGLRDQRPLRRIRSR